MKYLKFALIALIPLIVGCDEVKNLLTKKEEIYLVCKGEKTEVNSKYEIRYSDKNYTTTYTFKKDHSKNWMMERDGGKSTIYTTPPRKESDPLKSSVEIEVKPERIDVSQVYIKNESQDTEYEESIWTTEINRISGEWRVNKKTTGKTAGDRRGKTFINGTCEKGSIKF
jgi:hypothetical protein